MKKSILICLALSSYSVKSQIGKKDLIGKWETTKIMCTYKDTSYNLQMEGDLNQITFKGNGDYSGKNVSKYIVSESIGKWNLETNNLVIDITVITKNTDKSQFYFKEKHTYQTKNKIIKINKLNLIILEKDSECDIHRYYYVRID